MSIGRKWQPASLCNLIYLPLKYFTAMCLEYNVLFSIRYRTSNIFAITYSPILGLWVKRISVWKNERYNGINLDSNLECIENNF